MTRGAPRWGVGRIRFKQGIEHLLNRGLPETSRIRLRIGWPLWVLPIVVFNQLLAPHPVWVVLCVTLAGLYGLGYLWARSQAPAIALGRHRLSAILVAGDLLQEEFEFRNASRLPVLWAEFIDHSTLPGYQPGRVVACGADSAYRWRVETECKQRGVFRLGPHTLNLQDPLGLFSVQVEFPYSDMLLIYPRVVQLPRLALPHGNAQGTDRRRRPIHGAQPAATVSEYRPGDSLRHVHWRSTAHRSRLMVKDLEIEPSGDIWIVLDLNRAVQTGEGGTSTLETGVIVAASLTAELLAASERRAVGLLAVSGATADSSVESDRSEQESMTLLLPQAGQAQLWNVLAALAPVQASDVPLGEVLANSRESLGRRGSLIVITPQLAPAGEGAEGEDGRNWLAELLHLKASGVESSVILIAPWAGDMAGGAGVEAASSPPGATSHVASDRSEQRPAASQGNTAIALESTRTLLARAEIPSMVVEAGSSLQSVLTFRRRRKVIRSTPTGGVVTYEVEEEVG